MDTRLDPTQARTPRLASDFRRLLFSAAIGVPATAAAEGLYLAFSGSGLSVVAVVVAAYIFSAASSLAHFITTFAIFQNADAESLAHWVAATAPTGRLSRVQAEFAGTGPTISAQWSGLAIVSVVVLALSPDLLRHPLLVALSAAVVTTSWLVTIVSYAVPLRTRNGNRRRANVSRRPRHGLLGLRVPRHPGTDQILILRCCRRNNPDPQNCQRPHDRRIRLQHGHYRPTYSRALPRSQLMSQSKLEQPDGQPRAQRVRTYLAAITST